MRPSLVAWTPMATPSSRAPSSPPLTNGKPKMFFNHEWGMPIGKYTKATEDDHGLLVEGELTPGLSLSSDVRAAMKHGTLDGLSIGGYVKKGDYDETETGRVIRRWSTLMEVSPVVFPADSAARIDAASVKGGTDLIACGGNRICTESGEPAAGCSRPVQGGRLCVGGPCQGVVCPGGTWRSRSRDDENAAPAPATHGWKTLTQPFERLK